ncbi:hypothetical protein EOM39_03675 [Candidatus Gracilibacteria bacterium]|nr:hypothetical protein [Candidatus Gracilibacteria bacterium]
MLKKKVDKSISNVDKIVTGLIIGGALASIFGASQTSLGKRVFNNSIGVFKKVFGFSYNIFGKSIVKLISLTKRKK